MLCCFKGASSLAPVVTPLEQFRVQYPEGRLIADLISMHEGQYVVRAAILHKGETLATGLAANVDVQMAEDKARERAIAALGIVTAGSLPLRIEPVENEPVEDEPIEDEPVEDEPVEDETEPYSESEALLEEEDLGPPIDAIEESDLEEDREEESDLESIAPARPSAAAIALENFSTSANPVDLSDVIAQTDVELARLGWTNVQGREYLEKTYGKRSRQQLTDEELMSFLLYLEDH